MKKSFFIAVIISILAVGWILSGVLGQDKTDADSDTNRAEAPAEIKAEKIPEVQVEDLNFQLLKDNVIVTGRTQASRKVNLSAEISGQIASIIVEKGGMVKRGDVIAKLGLQDRSARVAEAEQLLNQRQIQYTAAKDLSEKGFNSKVRLAEARAQLEAARAQLKQARVTLSNINIKAPFDGVVNDQMVELGDFVSAGSQVVGVVDLDPVEISGFLTEKELIGVKQGSPANIILLDGRIISGEISYIASVADNQTRTFEMEVSIPNPDHSIKEGLTAKIDIPLDEVKAYKISPSILSLSDNGSIGVKILDENNAVKFVPVNLLKDTPEYLWVGGLPDQIRLIIVGQEFVLDGQTVKPIVKNNQEMGTPE